MTAVIRLRNFILNRLYSARFYHVLYNFVVRLYGVQETVSSTLATRTMQSVLIGSEYPVMDTLLFYFPQNSYCNLFRGVAECYAFSSKPP